MTSSLTYDQAERAVRSHVQDALAALPQGARLDALGPPTPVPCSDDDGAPPSTPVSLNSYYWVVGLEPGEHRAHLDALLNRWIHQAWTVVEDRRPDDQFVAVGRDGYSMSAQLTADGSKIFFCVNSVLAMNNNSEIFFF